VWLLVALLFPVALLNYLDRQMLSTMKGSITADIPSIANKADWGIVLALFKWTYALLSPFGGWVADRFSKRHVIAGSLFMWSAVTWWTGHVSSLHELLLVRALMGISEAFYIPTALALITESHPSETRSRAVGVHQSGIYVGQILGGFAGYAAESPDIGWRNAFATCGFIGAAYALPLLFLLKTSCPLSPAPPLLPSPFEPSCLRVPPSSPPSSHPTTNPSTDVASSPWSALLTNRNFLLLVLYFTLPAIAGWVVRDWMPEILREKFQLGQGKAGVSAILFVQLASLAGGLAGGFIADRWMQKTARGRILTSAMGMVLFLPALFSVGNAGTLPIAILGLIVFGIGWGFFDCNNMPILCQIARPEHRATGYGMMNLMSISCGGFGDWIFGVLRDQGTSLNFIFGAFSGLALLSVGIVLLIRPNTSSPQH
jgi:MFS family permease